MQTVQYMVPKEYCQPNLAAIGTVHCVSPDNWNVAEFLRSRTAASRNTVQAYEQDLSVFIKWSEDQGYVGPDCIERTDVLGWVVAMHDEDVRKNHGSSYLRSEAILSMVDEKRNNWLGSNKQSSSSQRRTKLPRPLTREEINQLLDEDPAGKPT